MITLGLSIIVKNEEKYIEETLLKIINIIDIFSVSDTGSNDNTINIIQELCKKYNKELVLSEDKWVNFTHNRNIPLKRLFNRVDYILLLDADDHFIVNKPFKDKLQKNKNICYSILCRQKNNSFYSYKRRLIPGSFVWYYKYIIHEQLKSKDNYEIIKIDSDNYIKYTRPTSNENNIKYLNLMKKALENEPYCFNYNYHYALDLCNSKKYNECIDRIDYMIKNKAYENNFHKLLIDYKKIECLYRIKTSSDNIMPLIHKLLKDYPNILELIYIGVLTFFREKKYKEAYDLGINYYNKKITPNICGFTYYYDLYTFKYDNFFLENLLYLQK